MRQTILISIALLFTFVLSANNKPYFHKVYAKRGDNIYSFLKRYKLENAQCNFDKFYSLNNLSKDDLLFMGEVYSIPVLIYTYNSKSIKSSIENIDWEIAEEILAYNKEMKKNKLRKKDIATSKIIWVPYSQLNCSSDIKVENSQKTMVSKKDSPKPTPVKNTSPKNLKRKKIIGRNFPIFGKEHSYTKLIDTQLRNKVFYIVAGHGGPDPGAIGVHNGTKIYEDEYAYDISLRLVRLLIQHGATAYAITRDKNDGIRDDMYLKNNKDEYIFDSGKIVGNQATRLFQKTDLINKLYKKHKKQGIKEQVAISIHIDSGEKNKKTEIYFMHRKDDKKSIELATGLKNELKAQYKKIANKTYHGTIKSQNLHMLNETTSELPYIYIELGNIKNKSDQQRFLLQSNRQLIAEWLYAGIAKW